MQKDTKRQKNGLSRHHVCYEPEVIRNVRRGVHQVCTLLSRFNYLNDEEINAVFLACELKRKYEDAPQTKKPKHRTLILGASSTL